MDVSLDTDITIHLYNTGKEELLYKYFDNLYMHEFILEHEIKNKSDDVYKKIKEEAAKDRIIIVTKSDLIEIGMEKSFTNQLYDIKVLFDYGEANAIALASTLGISALVTDDTKEFGPHDTLVKELIQDVIPFAFYELLFLDYIQSDDKFNEFLYDFNQINNVAYPERPIGFFSRIKRVVRRFGKHGTIRDRRWMSNFCNHHNIDDYDKKMQLLHKHMEQME